MERMLANSDAADVRGPEAVNGSKTDGIITAVRKMPLFRQLVPMESAIGWPIPLRRDGRVYLTLPLFSTGTARSGGTHIELYPPFGAITLAWTTGRPVKYVNFAFESPWPRGDAAPVGIFPHDAVRGYSVGEYRALRRELLARYDELFESLAGGAPFSVANAQRFAELLRLLVEPSLEPYYRTLGKNFFERFLDGVD